MMRKAFTLIELIFVMVVVGIIASVGTNLIPSKYTEYAKDQVTQIFVGKEDN